MSKSIGEMVLTIKWTIFSEDFDICVVTLSVMKNCKQEGFSTSASHRQSLQRRNVKIVFRSKSIDHLIFMLDFLNIAWWKLAMPKYPTKDII